MEFAQKQLNSLTNPKNAEMWMLRAIMVLAAAMYSKKMYNDHALKAALFVTLGNMNNVHAIATTVLTVLLLNKYYKENFAATRCADQCQRGRGKDKNKCVRQRGAPRSTNCEKDCQLMGDRCMRR